MKILLLGSGLLGAELKPKLADLGEVFAWGKDELDITDNAAVQKKIADLKPDVVVNAAAYADVDGCEKNPKLAQSVNSEAVGFLARACLEAGAKLAHFSTDYIFDGEKAKGYTEKNDETRQNPVNEYGRSKLLGEKNLRRILPPEKFLLIRTSWLFGAHGKNFVTTMRRLGREKKTLKVVDDQIGCPTFAPDLAEAACALLQKNATGIFHLTNAGSCSWFKFAQEIFRLDKLSAKLVPVSSVEFPRPARRPRYSVLVNTKTPLLRPWQEALKEYLNNH